MDARVVSVKTEADFNVATVVDLEVPSLARVQFQLKEFEDDGETLGDGAGEVNLAFVVATSFDKVTWVALTVLSSFVTGDGFTLGPQLDGLYACARYVRVTAEVQEDDAIYAGANDPYAVGDVRVSAPAAG